MTFDIFTAVAIAPLRAWDLTRSLFFFPLLPRQPQKHAILVSMMIEVATDPQGYSHYNHLRWSSDRSL